MKTRIFVLAAILGVAANAPAQGKEKPQKLQNHNFILDTPITVDGAYLESGAYELNLVSSGARVRLEFWQGSSFIATATGTWISGGEKYAEDSLLLRLHPDGSRSLTEVRIAGTKKSIAVDHNAEGRVSAKRGQL